MPWDLSMIHTAHPCPGTGDLPRNVHGQGSTGLHSIAGNTAPGCPPAECWARPWLRPSALTVLGGGPWLSRAGTSRPAERAQHLAPGPWPSWWGSGALHPGSLNTQALAWRPGGLWTTGKALRRAHSARRGWRRVSGGGAGHRTSSRITNVHIHSACAIGENKLCGLYQGYFYWF